MVLRNLDFMDQAFHYGSLSKQSLLYDQFHGLICFLVLISFNSIDIFFHSNMSLCMVSALLLWLLVKLALESKQWFNKNGLCYGYCGSWYIGDIPQQGHDRYDGIFIDWNMDCGGAVSLFSGIMIYSIDQSRCQQWGRGAAALKRRITVRSINGVEVRRRGIMICYGIKVTTAQWWHRQFGFFEWANLVHVVVRPNIDQMFTVLILIKVQLGGEGFVITLSTLVKWSICLWCFGKGFVGFNFIILCTLKIIYKDVDTFCDIALVLFLKSQLGVWVFWFGVCVS